MVGWCVDDAALRQKPGWGFLGAHTYVCNLVCMLSTLVCGWGRIIRVGALCLHQAYFVFFCNSWLAMACTFKHLVGNGMPIGQLAIALASTSL
jgi:hypothetical protein